MMRPQDHDPSLPILDADVLRYIDRSVLCWLATVDEQGHPNVSPKEIFVADGDGRLLIAHIASPGSVRNLEHTAWACVSFVDVFVQRGYKLRGTAEVVRPGEEGFAKLEAPLAERTGGLFPIHAVIVLTVTQVEPLLAPSYVLVPGTTEESQLAAGLITYGLVRPGLRGSDPGPASGEPGNRVSPGTCGRTAP